MAASPGSSSSTACGSRQIGLDHYRKKQEQEPDNERFAFLVDEMTLATEQAADRPFFKVVMHDARSGFAAGAYGLLFRTEDGGESWFPVMELLDLDQLVHLFDHAALAPAPAAGDVAATDAVAPQEFLSGEMGTLLTLDPSTGHWRRLDFPYDGSMFTLLATRGGTLVTGGLRGLVFRSTDRGLSWQEANKPQTSSVVAGTVLADGRVVIATQEGNLFAERGRGREFHAAARRGSQTRERPAGGASGRADHERELRPSRAAPARGGGRGTTTLTETGETHGLRRADRRLPADP